MTIADCIYYDGLSPLFGGSTHFCQILKLAKTVDNNFQIPGRNQTTGFLLNKNFTKCWEKKRDSLLVNVSVFGLSFLGNGATIHHMQFIATLGMCGGLHSVLLVVNDYTKHLANGGVKNAAYIANLFVEQMEELFSSEDQHEMFGTLKDNTDVILMDGTSSV